MNHAVLLLVAAIPFSLCSLDHQSRPDAIDGQEDEFISTLKGEWSLVHAFKGEQVFKGKLNFDSVLIDDDGLRFVKNNQARNDFVYRFEGVNSARKVCVAKNRQPVTVHCFLIRREMDELVMSASLEDPSTPPKDTGPSENLFTYRLRRSEIDR